MWPAREAANVLMLVISGRSEYSPEFMAVWGSEIIEAVV